MHKPIEPGCLCVIKVGPAAGGIVTVERWVLADERIAGWAAGQDGWLVSNGEQVGVYKDSGLMRIDGGDPDAVQGESQDQEVPTDAIA